MENFKAYLITIEGGAKEQEIRRFTIDSDVATNFIYLREKLQCIFPILRGKRFTVTWKDIEGDPITISSDEELRIALQESPQGTNHKLYVILQSDESTSMHIEPEEEVGIIHHNVICDGCEKVVKGFRYKCMECPDYDLCSGCEGKSLHSGHCMLRIAEPLQWSSRYGKRLAHHVKKFIRSNAQYNGREENVQECPVMKEKRRRHHSANCGSSSIIGTLVDFLNDTPGYASTYPMRSNASKPPETATEATPTCGEPQSQETKGSSTQEAIPPIDLLTIVEDTIAPVLNNLGININFKTKNDEKSDPKPNDVPTSQPESKEASVINDKSDKSSDDDEWTIVNKEKTPDASESAQTLPRPLSSLQRANENVPQEGITPSAPQDQPTNGNLYPPLPQPSTTQVRFNLPTTTQPMVTQPTVAQPTLVQPTATKPSATKPTTAQPTLYHSNPKIQSAVVSMMDMGFSNEGGWLTQLLVLKDGDVEKVLDMLSPVGM